MEENNNAQLDATLKQVQGDRMPLALHKEKGQGVRSWGRDCFVPRNDGKMNSVNPLKRLK
jgi:hypothetical protein